jgi:hypothetical protein
VGKAIGSWRQNNLSFPILVGKAIGSWRQNNLSFPICEGHRNFLVSLEGGHVAGLGDRTLILKNVKHLTKVLLSVKGTLCR